MGNLSELNIRTTYRKGRDDIAKDFYLPCLSQARTYDRAVGFFRSTVYMIAWEGLKDFVSRGGKMRVICSPFLSLEDIAALEEGYRARIMEENAKHLQEEIQRMLNDRYLEKPTRVLAALVALGILDFRIAFMRNTTSEHRRLFHDKVGIFTDELGNSVVFKGSMNETEAALANDGNLESIDVFVSWAGERESLRVKEEIDYFESLWDDRYPTVLVTPFPEVAWKELVDTAGDAVDSWPDLVDEICAEINDSVALSPERGRGARILRWYQVDALQAWHKRGRRGIFEHITGSGKTFTALSAIRDSLERREIPVILVPSDLLLEQWEREVRQTLQDLNPSLLLCGAGHTRWRKDELLRTWTNRAGNKPRIVISTIQTAASEEFLKLIYQGDHLFLVADEVHRLGSPHYRRIFNLQSGPRLGLSATPRRFGDPIGTNAIFDYFGEIVSVFTLQDAIKAGVLTPYMYYVHPILLTDEEQKEWNNLTSKIRQIYLKSESVLERGYCDTDFAFFDDRLKKLLIERARIVKRAKRKIQLVGEVLQKFYQPGQKWIIYCDNQEQLKNVLDELINLGLNPLEYHSAMDDSERKETLRYFERMGGILVSIRCLDEGVDIPSVSHALILASSKNPREFIQRRGRVLRKAPQKSLAFIHDAIVIPQKDNEFQPDAILENELARAIEFGKGAENPSCIADLERIALQFGIEYEKLAQEGFEDDDPE